MISLIELLSRCASFEWDDANAQKNWVKHEVLAPECEQVFFNTPLLVSEDVKHSKSETRYLALGKTDFNRKLFVIFTVRSNSVRVISARDMNRKERGVYEASEKENPKL